MTKPIILVLGACSSSSVAESWSQQNRRVPVRSIVAFAGEPSEEDVLGVLEESIKMSDIRESGSKTVLKDVSFPEEDLERFRELFRNEGPKIYYRAPVNGQTRYVEGERFPEVVGMTIEEYHVSKAKGPAVQQLFDDVQEGIEKPDPIEELIARWARLKKSAARGKSGSGRSDPKKKPHTS